MIEEVKEPTKEDYTETKVIEQNVLEKKEIKQVGVDYDTEIIELKRKVESSCGLIELVNITLNSSSTSLDSGTFEAMPYLKAVVLTTGESTASSLFVRFNGDTGNNCSWKISLNNAALASNTGFSFIQLSDSVSSGPFMCVLDIFNALDTSIKGISGKGMDLTVGDCKMYDYVGAWNNTTKKINRLVFDLGGTATLNAGSKLIIYGSKY